MNVSVNRYQETDYNEIKIKVTDVVKNIAKTDDNKNEIPDSSENLNIFICNELIKRHNNQIQITDSGLNGKMYSFLLKRWYPEQN